MEEFFEDIFKGRWQPWVVILFFSLFVLANHIKGKPIQLPKEAHNVVGNIPIVESFDDGGTNREDQGIESRPSQIIFPKKNRSHSYPSRSIVTMDIISFD